ncbi:Acetyltransferase, GNAT family [Halobacillus alkaliphilus]|uniref:Acetyltransferase, GNAT family n=1 Tax=Halobacillus alkaliphilus TaxID=396056 RepID=A0A1I2PTT8_9BACI|nr:GNAT family N-acetyltransferase [Halobacillus alkaliphilus]SFG19532.1 Acetyltransferase, GNAT family [Halobacillus alkaliphilus]
MEIRSYSPEDIENIHSVIQRSVRAACAYYKADQIDAWASALDDKQMLHNRLAKSDVKIAVSNGGRTLGVASLLNDGVLDLFYVEPDCQRKEVGSRLLLEIEKSALTNRINFLETEASVIAFSFFKGKGFKQIRSQHKLVQEISLNYPHLLADAP